MIEPWQNIIARNIDTADISIVFSIIGLILFVRFNQHEERNRANQWVGMSLAACFFMLVVFRIAKVFIWWG